MYGLYRMSGPYIVLMYGSTPYIFCPSVGKFYYEKKAICADIVNISLKITLPSEAVYF